MNSSNPPMDDDTARRILARVPHARRFPVGRLVPPVGLLQSSVRGLEELALALRPELHALAGVHTERLADWIEREVGDPVGAAEVRDAVRAAPSYAEACRLVHERIQARVAAARSTLETAPDGPRQGRAHEGEG